MCLSNYVPHETAGTFNYSIAKFIVKSIQYQKPFLFEILWSESLLAYRRYLDWKNPGKISYKQQGVLGTQIKFFYL